MGFVESTISFFESFMDIFTRWDRYIKVPVAFVAGFLCVFFITIIPILYFGLKLLKFIDQRNMRRNQSNLERVSSVGLTTDEGNLDRIVPEIESSTNSITIYSYIKPATIDNIYDIVSDDEPMASQSHIQLSATVDSSMSTHCAVFYKKPNDMELKEIKTE